MGLTNFPNGVSSFGMPVVGSGSLTTTGNVFFVDSGATNASDANDGKDPARPLATLNGAFNTNGEYVTANNGDIVFLMPGHAEDVSAATSAVCDVAGVKVVGLGTGRSMPTFTWTATAGTFEADAANLEFHNIRFLSSISAVVVGVNVDADNIKFFHCEWDYDASGDDFLIMADVDGYNTADTTSSVEGTEFHYCRFLAEETTAGSNEAIRMQVANETVVKHCVFKGDFATTCIYGDTTGDTQGTTNSHLEIMYNTFLNDDTVLASGACIDLNTADTGVIAYNTLGHTGDGIADMLDPGSCRCFENYGSSAADVVGGIVPQTADT